MSMSMAKKKSFVAKSKRQKFAYGGLALPPRQRFVDGGTVHALTAAPAVTTNSAANPNTGLLGPIGQLLGLNDQFQAGSAMITPGTNVDQLNASYQNAIDSYHRATNFADLVAPGATAGAGAQSQLLGQELAMSRGEGPNPALAQLREQTGRNVAAQTAMQAGQRGANANVGLIARNAARTGADVQQQAAGQEATLEAQQQIAAQQRAEALAGTTVGQGQTATNMENTNAQGEQNILQGANTSANNAAVNMQSNINATNAQTAIANQDTMGKLLGGITSAASGGLGKFAGGFGLAKGGKVCEGPHKSHVANFLFAEGGDVPSMVSAEECYLSPDKVKQVIHEGKNPLKIGVTVPGKAKVKGDSYANDTIEANLEAGGVVIPRHITTMKDKKMAAEKAELFVHRAMARKKAGRK